LRVIANGLRWALYLWIAASVCLILFFASFLAGGGFFSGLFSGSRATDEVHLVSTPKNIKHR
jgi:hypothetical protein